MGRGQADPTSRQNCGGRDEGRIVVLGSGLRTTPERQRKQVGKPMWYHRVIVGLMHFISSACVAGTVAGTVATPFLSRDLSISSASSSCTDGSIFCIHLAFAQKKSSSNRPLEPHSDHARPQSEDILAGWVDATCHVAGGEQFLLY